MEKQGYFYLMMNVKNTVIYAGVTSDLQKRVYKHRESQIDGFTKKYKVIKLVYYEVYDNMSSAIDREKQIKSGPRKKKIDLIRKRNPEFRDLYEEL